MPASRIGLLLFSSLFFLSFTYAQSSNGDKKFTHADSLRGSLSKARTWWDVQHYSILVEPDYAQKTISGKVDIQFKAIAAHDTMQIDLQAPMQLNKVYLGDEPLHYFRDGNAYFIVLKQSIKTGTEATLALSFSGKVREAIRPPWDGGWIFSTDKKGNPWMSVACQGLGASVWYPCKDHQSDEPDRGALLRISVPDTLMAIGNGRLKGKQQYKKGWTVYDWEVKNPINNYNIIPYIGKYAHFNESYAGEKGKLDCDYWVLEDELEKAKEQFKQVPLMLKAFEHWFGAYPFYEDGFKLVQSPHLGMEHQSAVAYGNGFQNGYRGRDLSGSGWGLKWDFIIVHESGHEWFGNNITSNDLADMWLHESFTNYSETLFTDFHFGTAAGNAYVQGTRALIRNDAPIIATYNVNDQGSGDMYYKGGNLVHIIRQLFKSDEKFRTALRELNKTFYHKTVNTEEVESFFSTKTGLNLSPVFDQYLRNTSIPTLEIKKGKKEIMYRWKDCIPSFNMPVRLMSDKESKWIYPTSSWKTLKTSADYSKLTVDKNFYVGLHKSS
jgi:aminopeptidase N